MSDPFVAEIKIFAGNFAPTGHALCNGQLLPISQNTALFSLLGTTFGGDGRSTFALPNLQGRAPMQPGQGPGLTQRFLGEAGGVESVTLNQSQIPLHSHALRAKASADQASPSSGVALGNAPMYNAAGAAAAALAPAAVSPVGGGEPHNNMQPYLTLNFIIAMQGIFPARS
jgi:microcystin-dependent protein